VLAVGVVLAAVALAGPLSAVGSDEADDARAALPASAVGAA
jgi:hypothetical protein